MIFTVVLCLLSILTLSACQFQFEETHYAPLQADGHEFIVVQRSLDGPLLDEWRSTMEPIIQSQCIQCHGEGDPLSTGLEFDADHTGNLLSALKIVREANHLPLTESTHGLLSSDQQQAITHFEIMAKLYWPWYEQLQQLETQAQNFYTDRLDATVIQPSCSVCHRVQDGREANLYLGLSFYPLDRNNHDLLNARYSMEYLLLQQDPLLLFKKATNLINHGGGESIHANTEYADNLQQHGEYIEKIITTLQHHPF